MRPWSIRAWRRIPLARPNGWLTLLTLAAGLQSSVAHLPAQQLPEGFHAELIAQPPEVEHPSTLTCDDRGNLFIGEDPMDMRGPATREFDRVILYRFATDKEPTRRTVFCEGLSAVFGLIWHEGALYVMHAPHYSVFRDTDGDGVADEREDLAEGFGPPAGIYGFNDHIVSGIQLGLDGRVYVSVGDKGIQRATGSDGSAITLEGGGIVRMRLDGTELEVVSSGTRNHLDVALDSLDNMFTYDNTDDGLGWWTRFTHHMPTGYYGYPYDYHDHSQRHLPRISEHGGGSPCGGACYRDAAWPAEYRDNVFFAEWGKGRVQRFTLTRNGATFDAAISDFMTPDGSGEFRPVDLCFSPDGRHMYVADWNFGGWVQPTICGRVYRVTYVGEDVEPEPARAQNADPIERQLAALEHPAHSERVRAQYRLAQMGRAAVEPLEKFLIGDAPPIAKIHAIWAQHEIAERNETRDPLGAWTEVLEIDESPDVRAQAARALGLWAHDGAVENLIGALDDPDPTVRMYAAVGLGRIGHSMACERLWQALGDEDRFAQFAAIQALRAIGDWSLAPEYLDAESAEVRQAAAVVMTGLYDVHAVEALAAVAHSAEHVDARSAALASLAEVYRRADPYRSGWWGTQPARSDPQRPKKHAWEGSDVVATAIQEALAQSEANVRRAAIAAVQTLQLEGASQELRRLVVEDSDAQVRMDGMVALAALRDRQSVPVLAEIASAHKQQAALRTAAVRAIVAIGSEEAVAVLVEVIEDDSSAAELLVLALNALADLGDRNTLAAIGNHLQSASVPVRTAAVDAYGRLARQDGLDELLAALADGDVLVRRASLRVLEMLNAPAAVPAMMAAADDPEVEYEALLALAATPDARALAAYLRGLVHANAALRDKCRAALVQLRDAVGPEILALYSRNELPDAVLGELAQVYSAPTAITRWQMLGSWPAAESPPDVDRTQAPQSDAAVSLGAATLSWQAIETDDANGGVTLNGRFDPDTSCRALAYAPLESEAAGAARLLIGSDDQCTVWLNGTEVYRFEGSRGWAPDQADVEVELGEGTNHLWLEVGNDGGPWMFSVQRVQLEPRYAVLGQQVPPRLNLAAYAEHAVNHPGDAARGEKLFRDVQGIGCIKCHGVGGGQPKAGPDLLGVGVKYPQAELIRSVLEPSSRILSGYELTTVITSEGRVVQGVVKSRNEAGVELFDVEGRAMTIVAEDIDEIETGSLSMMPNGLKDGMSLDDFADIIAYLQSLRDPPPADVK